MEFLDRPITRMLAFFIGAVLASALVQRGFGNTPSWPRAFAFGFGLVTGILAADHFGLAGFAGLVAIAMWVALLVGAAELYPEWRSKSRADAWHLAQTGEPVVSRFRRWVSDRRRTLA